MQDNRNTTENAPLDSEDWQIAFEPYAHYPLLALVLAQHLSALQEYVASDAGQAIAAITRAVDELYEHSEFHTVSRYLFRAHVQGRLPADVENILNALGIRT
jgi:hypothetical protein